MIDKQKLLDLLNENFKENVKWMDKNLESFNENRYNHLLQHAMEDNVRIRLLEQITEFVEDMKTLPVILKDKESRFMVDGRDDDVFWVVDDKKHQDKITSFNYGCDWFYTKSEAKKLAYKECERLNKKYGDSE